jgi:hypothetical protein
LEVTQHDPVRRSKGSEFALEGSTIAGTDINIKETRESEV